MRKTVLIEQTAKTIKAVELAILTVLFVATAFGLGLLYVAVPLGIIAFCVAGLCFVAFCCARTYRWWMHG